jgi:hypothetical protein
MWSAQSLKASRLKFSEAIAGGIGAGVFGGPAEWRPAVPEGREAFNARSEITLNGEVAVDEMRKAWAGLGELGQEARECCPLTPAQGEALRQDLKGRIEALYEGEKEALRALGAAVA